MSADAGYRHRDLQAPRAGGRPRHGRPAPALRRHERRRRPPRPRLPRLAARRRRLPAARRLPRRPRLRPRHGLRQQPGQPRPPHRGQEHRPLHPGEQAEVLLRRGHGLRGPQAGAARLPLRAPGLAGALPAGHADRAPLRRQRPRPLHPRHGLHHLRPHRRPGAGHAEQVFSGHPGAAGQLGPGLADRGGAGHPAEPLPDDGEHRPHHHRPRRLLRLQVRGHDRGRRVRAAVRQDGLLPAAELVLRYHLLLHDPHAAPEDPVGGGGRGRAGARGQEPAAHVPHHGHRRAAAGLHVLAHLPPRLVSPPVPARPLAPRGRVGAGPCISLPRRGRGWGLLAWLGAAAGNGGLAPVPGGSSVAPASLLQWCSRCPCVLDTPGPLLSCLLVAAACVTQCYRLRPGLTSPPPPLSRGLALAPALATSPLPPPPHLYPPSQ